MAKVGIWKNPMNSLPRKEGFTNPLDQLYKPWRPQPLPTVQRPQPSAPTQRPQPQPSYDPFAAQQAYFNQMIALREQQRERERQERERIKQGRIDAANRAYDSGAGKLNTATEDAQRQAYIKRMQDEKDIQQQLQAMGISGGATESTLSGIKSAYGNNRADIEKAKLAQLGALEQDKLNAIAAAEADEAAASMAAERDYTDGLIQTYASFLPTLTQARSSGRGRSVRSSAPDITKTAGYRRAETLFNRGGTAQEIANDLERQGLSQQAIADYLDKLGLL